MNIDKTFRLSCTGRTPKICAGNALWEEIEMLESHNERAILLLMPLHSTYTDSDGDTWERIA